MTIVDIKITSAEHRQLYEEIESLTETWTTARELYELLLAIVRAHGYEPRGDVRHEAPGASSWIIETDRGTVRVTS